MFLQYFIWGAWYVTLATWLTKSLHFSGEQIGLAAGTTAVGAMIAPFFVGLIADKLFSTQRVLAVLHLLGGLVLLAASLQKLGLDQIDLYLIHWPAPTLGKFVESFEGMIQSKEQGHVRSIGVSNFTEDHLSMVIERTSEVPAVNQIELHPRLNQADLRQAHAEHDVVTQAYSPLGVGRLIDEPIVTSIAAEYGRSPAQVLVRWNLQLNNVVVSRSSKPERVAENLDVFDFALAPEHMTAIETLHDGTRVLHDPMTFTGT